MILSGPPYTLSPVYLRRRRLQIVLFGALGMLFLVACAWVAIPEAVNIVRDGTVWRDGQTALAFGVGGKYTTSRIIFRRYELEVDFADAQNTPHKSHVEFMTVFVPTPTNHPTVRYLASDPSRVALSWTQDLVAYRWLAVAAFLLFGVGLGAIFFSMPLSAVAELRLARAYAAGATETVLEVVGSKVDGQPVLGGPLFVDGAGAKVLALVSPDRPHQALVIRDTLMPYAFPAHEAARIRGTLPTP